MKNKKKFFIIGKDNGYGRATDNKEFFLVFHVSVPP